MITNRFSILKLILMIYNLKKGSVVAAFLFLLIKNTCFYSNQVLSFRYILYIIFTKLQTVFFKGFGITVSAIFVFRDIVGYGVLGDIVQVVQ